MSVEFTKAGEHRVHAFLKSVLSAHKEGRTDLHGAAAALFVAMRHAAHDDAQLDTHMRHWMEATRPPRLP